MQALGRPLAKIPRFFWTILAFLIYTIAGVAGREHFSTILSNFLAILVSLSFSSGKSPIT